MSAEHEPQHARTASAVTPALDDLVPGRANSAAQMTSPQRPVVSGLIWRRAREGGETAGAPEPALAAASATSGAPLPEPIQRKFESALGAELSAVRVHTGAESHAAAESIGAKAYTIGQDIHFSGNHDPASTASEHLLAHEVAHTVQQRGGAPARQHKLEVSAPTDGFELEADRAADAMIAGGSFVLGGAPVVAAREPDATATDNASRDQPAMGYAPPDFGDDVATTPVEPRSTSGVIDAPIASIYGRTKPYKPVASVTSGTVISVKGYIAAAVPVYVVEYDGRMTSQGSQKVEGLARLRDLAVTSNGPAQPQKSDTMTGNDWMTLIPGGDPAAVTAALKAIEAARAAIDDRPLNTVQKDGPRVPRDGYQSKADDKTKDYNTWLDDAGTNPRLATDPKDIRWRVFKRLFKAEGSPSDIMTYDATNITWGVGFSGMGSPGVGLTEQMMSRLFNQSPASRDVFWRAGVTVVGTELYVVQVKDAANGKGDKLKNTAAEGYLRQQTKLLSLMTNVTQGYTETGQKDPKKDVRQDNLDAQFETFLNNTLRNSAGIIDTMEETAASVAAHAVHSGQHSWGEFAGATTLGGVKGAIQAHIKQLEDDKAAGKNVGYIVPYNDIAANI